MIATEDQLKQQVQNEMNQRELMRRSLDVIRIHNPLPTKFVFTWDGFAHSIAPGADKDVPRYLAMHYFKKIADYMIGLQMTAKGEELLKLRAKQFGKSYIDKYEENVEVWDRTPRLNDPDLVKAVYDTVVLGVVEEYGAELPDISPVMAPTADQRPLHEQIFSQADKFITKDDLNSEVSV